MTHKDFEPDGPVMTVGCALAALAVLFTCTAVLCIRIARWALGP